MRGCAFRQKALSCFYQTWLPLHNCFIKGPKACPRQKEGLTFQFFNVYRTYYLSEGSKHPIFYTGHSLTTFTRIWLFLIPYPPNWHFLPWKRWPKIRHFWTTYQPSLVNVVKECPLSIKIKSPFQHLKYLCTYKNRSF